MLYQLSEVKSLWLEQIRKTGDKFSLFTPLFDVALLSAAELKQVATRPYDFEHAILTGQLGGLDAAESTLHVEDQTDIDSLELAPGGRWLVALSVVREFSEPDPWGSLEIQVWDLGCVSSRSSDPISRLRLPSDQIGDIWPKKLSIQPEGQNILIFAFSHAVNSEIPLYVSLGPLDACCDLRWSCLQ